MKKIVLALLLVTIFACKNDKKEAPKETKLETKLETKVEKEEKDFIKITFNAIIPKDDTFLLQYKNEDKWFPNKGIKAKIIGSDQPQELVFSLPAKTYPTGFLFLVGKNNKENVIINSASFDLEGNTFLVAKENFFQFFNPNRFIDFKKTDNTYSLKDGENFRPFFNSRNLLIQRLEEKLY